jgi:hypothetical protein
MPYLYAGHTAQRGAEHYQIPAEQVRASKASGAGNDARTFEPDDQG